MLPATGPVCGRIGVLALLISLILIVPTVALGPFVVAGGKTVDPAPSRGIRDCSGSLPPPAGPDGIRHGNWVISCGPSEPINITFETIKIQGNITIGAGSILNLQTASKIIMVQDTNMSYVLTIQDFSSLNIKEGSIIDVTALQTRPNSNLIIIKSHLVVRSNAHIDSSMFSARNSTVEVIAQSGKGSGPGSDAGLVLDTEFTELLNSTVQVLGGHGGEGADGGDSSALIKTTSGSFKKLTLNVTAGYGGHGQEPLSGKGQNGGAGGSARADLRTTYGGPITIEGSIISVAGGTGGGGGNGAMGQSLPGGDGGLGGKSGPAQMNISAGDINLVDTWIGVRSNAGGNGGKGGDSQNGAGGDGSAGGPGSDALVQLETTGQLLVLNSHMDVLAVKGGNGGFMGNGPVIGQSGDGGSGGSSTLKVQASTLQAKGSSMFSTAGSGGWGGLGVVSTGNGGDAGNALCELNITWSIIFDGTSPSPWQLGSVGGNGGNAGENLDSNSSSDIRGTGGNGGASATILRARSNIDITGTHLGFPKSTGGSGSRSGVGGKPEIIIVTPRFNLTDSIVEWTMTGFVGPALGQLRNTTVLASPIAEIDAKETMAKVLAYWTVNVNIPFISYAESWNVYVFSGNLGDRNLTSSSTLHGPYAHAVFELLGVVIGPDGPSWRNYTIIAKHGSNEQAQYTAPLKVVLNDNKRVFLNPPCGYCVPLKISSPDKGVEVRPSWLASCRSPTNDELQHGLSAPGCLKVEGEGSVNNPFGTIEDIRVKLTHPLQGSFLFQKDSEPPVSIHFFNERSSSVTWSFTWEVGKVDIANNTYAWMQGEWTIEVSAIVYVKDIPNNESRYETHNVSITITLIQDFPVPPSTIKVDAGLPGVYTIPYRATGVNVTFSSATVNASGKVIRMEWDYNNDGVVDWSYAPTDCKQYQTCAAPTTSYVYHNESMYNAVFCVIASSGTSACDMKKVQIMKEQKPAVAGYPQPLLIAIAVSIVSICVIIIAALVITSLSEATKYSIMAFILVPLYTRLKKEEMLDNYTRGEIRGYIVANPGAHYSRIKRDLSLNNGTLIYHLSTLEREGFIYSHRDDYYRRFYPRGRKPRPGANLTTVQETIIETLLDNPGLGAEDLALRLNKSRKVTNYHLVWLRRWGLIEAKDDGRKKTYTVLYEDEMEKKQDGVKEGAVAPEKAVEKDEEGPSEPSGP